MNILVTMINSSENLDQNLYRVVFCLVATVNLSRDGRVKIDIICAGKLEFR